MIITICRKPFKGSLVDTIKTEQCGGMNIDGTRIALLEGENTSQPLRSKEGTKGSGGWKNSSPAGSGSINDDWKKGRWPANFIVVKNQVHTLDLQSGDLKSPQSYVRGADGFNNGVFSDQKSIGEVAGTFSLNYGDCGGASRYFKVIDK